MDSLTTRTAARQSTRPTSKTRRGAYCRRVLSQWNRDKRPSTLKKKWIFNEHSLRTAYRYLILAQANILAALEGQRGKLLPLKLMRSLVNLVAATTCVQESLDFNSRDSTDKHGR